VVDTRKGAMKDVGQSDDDDRLKLDRLKRDERRRRRKRKRR